MQKQELEIVNIEQAKRLKALGFEWETDTFYFEDEAKGVPCPAPTVALALKWFRDVKGMQNIIQVFHGSNTSKKFFYKYNFYVFFEGYEIPGEFRYGDEYDKTRYNTYETAESALLDALLDYAEGKCEK